MAAIGALLLAGCGPSAPPPTPAACLGPSATISHALERAPAKVTLADGTSLSGCVRLGARHDVDLQELGSSLMRVSDDLQLAAQTNPQAALRLGYLIGAVRRGAAKTPGLAAQLARRIEQTAPIGDPHARGALQHGIALGEDSG